MLDFPEYVGEQLSEDVRYADPDLVPQGNPGQITSEAVKKVQKILTLYVQDYDRLAQWFGCYMTSPKYPDQASIREDYNIAEIRQQLDEGRKLLRNEGSRFAFLEQGKNLWLFVDGCHYVCTDSMKDLVLTLCAERSLSGFHGQSEQHDSLILDLLNYGSLYFSD